ncbi:MAG: RluA family pseudouridine synthase [Clostridia bacterium]|nr:RluA family pseudouridine synthase [Clostridia bacterium]
MVLKYIVKNNNYKSFNQLLKTELNISSRLLVKLIKNNKIMLNNNLCDTRITPQLNDKIQIMLDYEENNLNIQPVKMTLDIIYEDEGLLIVNKPSGIAVHPSMRHYNDSLSNGVRFYFDKIGLKKKIRPVNRLDLDTSGLVIFAKNEYIQECLIKQMKNGIFKKEYICIVDGIFKEKSGIINLPIARKEKSIIERCVNESGQEAITYYEVLQENNDNSVVKCILKTGRTHQIRVHMAYIGHPLLGDTLYGKKSNLISRQALHCYKMTFVNPATNKQVELKCDLPNDFNINLQ